MKINLKNGIGIIKIVPIGFSWTSLFFGMFVPLCRADIKWFAILLVATIICLSAIAAQNPIGLIIHPINIIFAFAYNKIYIKNLLNNGYEAADDFSKSILLKKGIISK